MVDTLSSGQPDLVRQVRPKLTDPAQVLLPLGLPCANPFIPRLLEGHLRPTIRRFCGAMVPRLPPRTWLLSDRGVHIHIAFL